MVLANLLPFILNSRWTIQDVDYDFSEAEANTVTDELVSRSSLQEREQEPKKIKLLLERDKEPPPTTVNEEEDVQLT